MDGLSAAASVIAVVQISANLFQLCQTFYEGVKEARNDIKRLRDEVVSLRDVLTSIIDLAEDPGSAKSIIITGLNRDDGPIQQCQKDLQGLVMKLDPERELSKMRKFGKRALKWPFQCKDVDNILAIIERHKATFMLALTAENV